MSVRSSLKRFRPIIERCESRALTTAGLGSLTAQVNLAPAHHVQAEEPQVVGTYAFVRFRNDTKLAEKFQITSPVQINQYWFNGLPGNGGNVVYYWTVTPQTPVRFTIQFETRTGPISTENRDARSWKGELPTNPAVRDALIAREGATYAFKEKNGFVSLEPK